MPTAVIALDFDPIVRVAGTAVRLETVAVAAAILVAIVLAAVLAGRMPADVAPDPLAPRPRLRRDDLLSIVIAIVPGAVLGGRLSYALVHADFYAADPLAIIDPARGSVELAGAVVGGTVTGALVAALVDGSVGRWLHVATLPVLLALGLGKLAAALGGNGQGGPSDLPWATAYLGPGPWGSAAAATPAHPAQLYEAAATLLVLLAVAAAFSIASPGARSGRSFLLALAAWAVVRAIVASTWRDPTVVGPLNAAQLIALALAAALAGLAAALRRVGAGARPDASALEPAWPDPATRPRF